MCSESVELFTKAILQQPFSSTLYSGRAYSVLQLKKPNAAIRDCEIALKLNPEDVLVKKEVFLCVDGGKAYKVRAFARRGLGMYEDALEDIEFVEINEGSLSEDLVQLREVCMSFIV